MKFFILLQRVIFGYILRNKFDGKSFYRSCSPMAMTTMSYQFGFQKILQNQLKFKNNFINGKHFCRNFLSFLINGIGNLNEILAIICFLSSISK